MSAAVTLLRHLLAVLALPFTVTVVVPWWILGGERETAGWLTPGVRYVLGASFVLVGLGLVVWTVALFARLGRGTLAPWDPPRRLVVAGPYRHVRNPMISGVLAILLGEAFLFASRGLLNWVGLFALINALYIPLTEEPMLRNRFGAEYDTYARHVPRLIPRLRPWTPAS